MLPREEFVRLTLAGRQPSPSEALELDMHYEPAAEAARLLLREMPGVGLLSVKKRLNAFFAVCRHIDQLVENGQIDESEGQLSILIMRLVDSSFRKACIMFDLRGDRYDIDARAEMPRVARQYLAGLKAYG